MLKIKSNPASKPFKLIINSNMTNDKTNFFDLLGKFKEVTFFASIDGYGLTQEYIRYPSDWNQVSKNLTKLVDRQSENIMIRVAPVVQITNLNNIVDLFEFCEEFNRKAGKNVVDIFLVNLEFPKYLKITNLPVEYKKQCWERIENWVKTKCIYQKPLFHEQFFCRPHRLQSLDRDSLEWRQRRQRHDCAHGRSLF